MCSSISRTFAIGLLILNAALDWGLAQVSADVRRPRGIYAVVNVEDNISQQRKANSSITPDQLNFYFNNLYQQLLSDAAISGLTLQVHWDTLNPNPPAAPNPYDWSLVDDAFNQALIWNAQNPAQAPKTVQLIVTAGFQSPQWVLDQIPSCDGLFQIKPQTPPSTCGKATFAGYQEKGDSTELPLPWSAFYKSSWKTFLMALAARYGSNSAFVSIAVAGPTASSAEIIMPDNVNTPRQDQFGGILPNDMWLQLLAFRYSGMTAYQKSDQAFIDEWNAAIDMYGQIFKSVTLVVTTGGGLPNLGTNFTVPAAFRPDCNAPTMGCAAETAILAHFVDAAVASPNAKATQTSGMEASRANSPNLGLAGVKRLSQSTAQLSMPSTQILGGAQFNTTFSIFTLQEGCTSTFPPDSSDTPAGCTIPPTCTVQGCLPVACIPQACLAPGVAPADLRSYKQLSDVPAKYLIPPEQAEYNVLSLYFSGTPVASFFGGTTGTAPLNYLQIYSPDIQYAEANSNLPAQVVQTGGATESVSAQDLLNLASGKLLQIGEPALVPAIATGGIVPASMQPGEWVSIYGSNLATGVAIWAGNFPTTLGGITVTIDGKAAYLSFVSPAQINLQVPDDAKTGTVPVVVTTAIGSTTSNATLAAFSPSFFLLDGMHVAGIIVRTDGSGAYGGGSYDILGPTGNSLGYGTVAAKAGDIVELFGTGFGPTNPAVPAGQPFSGAAATTNAVTLRINNVSVVPTFAGLSGAGLYQLNVTIPAGLGTGDVSLQASVGDSQTASGVVISLRE